MNNNENPILELFLRGVRPPFSPFSPVVTTTQPHAKTNTNTLISYKILTDKTALLRPQPSLQHHHVGSLHTRPHSLPLHHQSLHHQHVSELLRHGGVGDACFPGTSWWVVVAGGCHDGEWVYFGWDEGWGLIRCSTVCSVLCFGMFTLFCFVK